MHFPLKIPEYLGETPDSRVGAENVQEQRVIFYHSEGTEAINNYSHRLKDPRTSFSSQWPKMGHLEDHYVLQSQELKNIKYVKI